MSQLDEVLALAANNTAGEFSLSGDSLAVLFYAMDFVQTLEAWKDFPDEELSSSEIDDIKALVDNAIDQLMRPIVSAIVGEGKMWFTSTPPDRWLLLDGTPASRTDYPELFDLWGTTYGAGDGSTTFDIPKLTGRSPIGAGTVITPAMVIGLGAAFGEYEHTLTVSEMPSHRHRVPKQSVTVNAAVNVATPAARTDNPATPHIETDLTGGGQAHNNIHPVWGVNFIVYGGKAP